VENVLLFLSLSVLNVRELGSVIRAGHCIRQWFALTVVIEGMLPISYQPTYGKVCIDRLITSSDVIG
jgi:hypothetical protein